MHDGRPSGQGGGPHRECGMALVGVEISSGGAQLAADAQRVASGAFAAGYPRGLNGDEVDPPKDVELTLVQAHDT
jgi:hypothetical protein